MNPMRLVRAAGLVTLVLGIAASPAAAANDPRFAEQWALDRIHAAEAWTRSTGRGIAIGVVDSGIDLDHEDLGPRVAAHVSCIGGCGGRPGQDDSGHGTFVAGVAGASADNGVGVAGVAPDATLVVAKVLNRRMEGRVDDIRAGIRWVVDHGAKVVNVSISDGGSATASAAPALRSALEYAWQRGAVPVVAAGTSDYGNTNAIVVTGTTASGGLAPASGRLGRAKWGLAAPGGDPRFCTRRDNPAQCITSTSWSPGRSNHYRTASGSSAAAPHVSGVIAQLLAAGYDQRGAVERVLATADGGRLDAAAALGVPRVAAPVPPPTPPPTPSPPPPPSPPLYVPPPLAAPAGMRAAQSLRVAVRTIEPYAPVSAPPAPPRP